MELLRVVLGLHAELTKGFSETISYVEIVNGVKHRKSKQVHHSSLMSQLEREIAEPRNIKPSEDKKANKSKSSIPGKFETVYLRDEISQVLKESENSLRVLVGKEYELFNLPALIQLAATSINTKESALLLVEIRFEFRRLVKSARIMLGYEKPKKALPDTPCGKCKGTLVVAEDAESDVTCVDCGHRYRRHEWVQLLSRVTGLVDTSTAIAYTGRPVGTLYRWASEGRVTRHGTVGKGAARWDLAELPQAIPGEPLPPAPKLAHARAYLPVPD